MLANHLKTLANRLSMLANWPLAKRLVSKTTNILTNLQCGQLPGGLIVQVVEHCISIAKIMGSNPVQFFSHFIFKTA